MRIDELWPFPRPWVIAHRGFSARAPENTLAAVDMALELGVDMIEVDVTLTRDGHVVVIHDEVLDRTTDGAGRVMESSLDYVRSLDAGSWFDPSFAGERVPLLEEVLERVRGRATINVEIKLEAVGSGTEPADTEVSEIEVSEIEVVRKVVRALRNTDTAEAALVSSFEPRALEALRRAAPEIRRGSLFNRQLHRGRRPSDIAGAVDAASFHVNKWLLGPRGWLDVRRHRLPFLVYTVNRPSAMRFWLAAGARGLFTDHPDRLLKLLR